MAQDKAPLNLSFDDPQTAVFLRILAWEILVVGNIPRTTDLVNIQIDAARRELGLKSYGQESGGPHAFLKKLRNKKLISEEGKPVDLFQDKKIWRDHGWRLRYSPPHNVVRQLAFNPIVTENSADQNSRFISFRDPSLPRIRMFYGDNTHKPPKDCGNGVYFLLFENSLYVGRTDEMDIRGPSHLKHKGQKGWIFLSPEIDSEAKFQESLSAFSKGAFGFDALKVAESLLISYWNEICILANKDRGADKQPPFFYLQQGVSLAKAASAALIWFVRDSKLFEWELPFKNSREAPEGWPEAYLARNSPT